MDLRNGLIMNYLDEFEGKSGASSTIVLPGKMIRLPPQPCKFVRLSRWNVSDDETFTVDPTLNRFESNNEVYYGFNGVLFGQLYISSTTDLIPVNNTSQITLRLPIKVASAAKVYFSWFW